MVSETAIGKDPKLANPYNHKGFSLYQLGKHIEGIQSIQKAIELDPKYGGSFFNLARIYSQEGKVSSAIINLRKSIKLAEKYRKRAKTYKDFDPIRNEPEFLKLIEGK